MDKKKEERLVQAVKQLSKLPQNKRCADCTEKLCTYVNGTHHTFICTACSGIHREFSHRVKSISLSTFTLEEVKALKEGGNEACAKLYLAKWDPRDYPEPEAGQEQRVRDWIRAKYIEKRWHADSNYVPRVRAGSRDADFSRRGSYDPHPTTGGHGGLSRSRAGSGGVGGSGYSGSSTRSLGGSGVPQSQPISAVLPDVKQVEVQRPHAHHQAPKKQSVDLLDLAFGPSSPERPPAQQPQPQQGGFAADPFASQPGLSASTSQGAWGAPPSATAPAPAVVGFPPSAQADPFATPHFPAPPAPLMPSPPQQQPPQAPSLYPPIPTAQPPQAPQQPWGAPPQQPLQQPPQGYYGAPPQPVPIQLPPGAVRPLAPAGPPKPPQTLSIEDAFSGLGLENSGSTGAGAGAGGSVATAAPVGPRAPIGGLPTFAAGEEVIYTDSQGNRSRTTVVKVHTDDHPPYYTIRLAGGAERQTDFHHIAKLAPPPQPQQQPPQAPTGSGVGAAGPPGGSFSPSPPPQPWDVSKAGAYPAPPPQQPQPFGAGPNGYPYGAPPQQPPAQQQPQANPFAQPAQQAQQGPCQVPVSGNPFDMF